MHTSDHGRRDKALDTMQERLTDYACAVRYENLTPEVIHAAKVRIIDMLGVLIGGFFGEPCRIARDVAAQSPDPGGATIVGTRIKASADMAAFANGTTARYLEMGDVYHWPGSTHGHASDALLPILSAAEHARVHGRDFITAVVVAYEVICRVCDVFHNKAFDNTNFASLGTAIAAGKLFGLSRAQLSHCVSMAVVPNVVLRQVRMGHVSMWKVVAAGQAGRAGVFAAMLARTGMEGPHLPFEGRAGWCDHVAKERLSLDALNSNNPPSKILDTLTKHRPAMGETLAAIFAAEKIAPIRNADVKSVKVEVYGKAKLDTAFGEHQWNPDSPENANKSCPYVVAATLIDGTITPRSFNDAHLHNAELRALMQKIEVAENEQFTQAYKRSPHEHRARITLETTSGDRPVAESGADRDDLSWPKSDAQIEDKFCRLTEELLGAKRPKEILHRLWHLEDLGNVAEIPPAFVLG